MKWFNRTAQGFSPGLSMARNRPESGGRGRGPYENGLMAGGSNQQMEITQRTLPAKPIGRHFQGAGRRLMNPGLKPWAMFYNRFAVNPEATACEYS